MKLLILLALVAFAVARPDGTSYYDTKYDYMDVPEILANPRLTKAYVKCWQGVAKCTPEGTEVKSYMPDAIQSSCSKCTEKQKKLSASFIQGLQTKYPEDYAVLYKIHDPEGKSSEELKKFLAKYGA